MAFTALAAMVRKDLQLFFSDRRSVIVSFVVPIAIASFFGALFNDAGGSDEPARIDVAIVDLDDSAISRGILAGARGDSTFAVTTPPEAEARAAVQQGDLPVAVIIPDGFGDAAGQALFGGANRPPLDLVYDPSRTMELAVVRGVMTQHVMQAVTGEVFGGQQGQQIIDQTLPQIASSSDISPAQKQLLTQMLTAARGLADQPADPAGGGRPGLAIPYSVREQAMTSAEDVPYNGYAHSFGGMAVQFLLFAMANLGVEMLLERRRGLWKRFRSAPVSKVNLLAGKAVSGALISLLILAVCFLFAIIVFGVRVYGSLIGMVLIAVACALMASSFGLVIAAFGNSPATARGITTLAVLVMVMLGGAWVPAFVFPAWLQQVTLVIPVRWAVDGFDAMTWRGQGMEAAVAPVLVLMAFAILFSALAAARFRWEEA
ncbi:MAG: ABC transporter permease [Vicinamibacterales bacterium]